MASFWITKRVLIEALKVVEGRSLDTCICLHGKSVVENGIEKTVTEISACGKKKTIKQNFEKIALNNTDLSFE